MLQEFTSRITDGRNLTEEEAGESLQLILSESTSHAEIAAFLTALFNKGETAQEICGFARIMRRHAVSIKSHHSKLIDTAGTGGGTETFNISTTAALVIAGAGLAVAKHGNRAVTSRCGSADVLAALGVRIDQPPEVAERSLNECGLAFLFAPVFHPAMKRVAEVRRELEHRTIFNLLGPLTNPASAPYQIIGVYSTELTEKLARAAADLGVRRAWVVHSHDGMDELSANAAARVSEVRDSVVRTFEFQPESVGLVGAHGRVPLQGGTPEENAEMTLGILEGRTMGPPRDVVLLNAGAALHVAGEGPLNEAIKKAGESLDSGAAREKLQELIRAYSSA